MRCFMSEIEYIICTTNDIEELRDYVIQLKRREDKLIAVKAINDFKAKNKKFSDSERLAYVELQLDLLDIFCNDDLDETYFLEEKEKEDGSKVIIHPSFPIKKDVVGYVKNSIRFMRKKIFKIKNS